MSRYRKIDTRMWSDEEFRTLSKPPANGQSLFQYCLTGPFTTNIPGLFSAGEAAMAERLEWSLKSFRETFAELSRKPLVKADWHAHLVYVPNAIKYNVPQNPNVVKGWSVVWDELPECALKVEAYQHLKSFLESLNKSLGQSFAESCRNHSLNHLPNQEQEQEQEQDPPLPPKGTAAVLHDLQPEEVLQKWNALPGVKPCKALVPTIRDRIQCRIKEQPRTVWWTELFEQVAKSKFLTGRIAGKDGAFHASLDWVLRPKNLDKILAGNYDDGSTTRPPRRHVVNQPNGTTEPPPADVVDRLRRIGIKIPGVTTGGGHA